MSILNEIIYWILPLSLIFAGIFVFKARNPVYGILSFVFVVLQVSILLVAIGQEFLGFILAIVYIGAIVVLFLFVTMMFHIKGAKENIFEHAPLRVLGNLYRLGTALLFFIPLGMWVSYNWFRGFMYDAVAPYNDYLLDLYDSPRDRIIAEFLFNEYGLVSIILGMIMLVGIVGAIFLASRHYSSTNTSSSKKASSNGDGINKIRSSVDESITKIK